MTDEPQARTLLKRLKQAHAAPRCGARTRRGGSCAGPAMRNGRLPMHGGASTGPRTPEERSSPGQLEAWRLFCGSYGRA
jgi:hypothetical protein